MTTIDSRKIKGYESCTIQDSYPLGMRTNQRFSGQRERNIDKKPIDIKGGKQLIFTIENTMINHGQDCSHLRFRRGKSSTAF